MIGAIGAMQGIVSELSSLAGAASGSGSVADPAADAAAPGAAFSDVFGAALNRLDGAVTAATTQAKTFAAGGDDVPLSDVMVSLEQAGLSMQLAANIRDKVTTAYANVMNMPV